MLVVNNIIAAVVAELVEHGREAQHQSIFLGVLRHFLTLDTDQIALIFGDFHDIHWWL